MAAANAPTGEHVVDLVPGYALGSLDATEMQRVSAHLAHCAGCRAELEAYRQVVDSLYLAVPLAAPRPEVKQQLMQRLAQQPPVQVGAAAYPAPAEPVLPEPRATGRAPAGRSLDGSQPVDRPATPRPAVSGQARRSWRDWFSLPALIPQPLALAGLLLIVVLSVSNVWLWQRLQGQAAMPVDDFRLVNLAGTQDAPGASAVLVMNQEGTQGTLVAADLPTLDPAHQYQLWLIKDGRRTSGGVFSVNAAGYGSLLLASPRSLFELDGFGVTVEPAGGSLGPTGKKVLGGVVQ